MSEKNIQKSKPFYSISEASKTLGVCRNTCYGYIRKGLLRRVEKRGVLLGVPRQDVERLLSLSAEVSP